MCTVAALGSAPVLAQFRLDLPPDQVRKANGDLVVADLAVGEVAIVVSPLLCSDGDRLHIAARTLLSTTPLEYGVNWRVRREPGDTVSVALQLGVRAGDTTTRSHLVSALHNAPDCALVRQLGRDATLFGISSVDGAATLSEFLSR
jgi:hypothetical protein